MLNYTDEEIQKVMASGLKVIDDSKKKLGDLPEINNMERLGDLYSLLFGLGVQVMALKTFEVFCITPHENIMKEAEHNLRSGDA